MGTASLAHLMRSTLSPLKTNICMQKSTIWAPHQLLFCREKQFCDYCKLIRNKRRKTICSVKSVIYIFVSQRKGTISENGTQLSIIMWEVKHIRDIMQHSMAVINTYMKHSSFYYKSAIHLARPVMGRPACLIFQLMLLYHVMAPGRNEGIHHSMV